MGYLGKQVATVQYPDAMVSRWPRWFRASMSTTPAAHCLRDVAPACPVDCITIATEGKGKAAVVTRYAIDYSRCLLCALCVDPCPTNCLHMGKVHDLSCRRRSETTAEFTVLAGQGRRTPEPAWLAQARKRGEQAPEWLRVLADHYRPVEPMCGARSAKWIAASRLRAVLGRSGGGIEMSNDECRMSNE